MDNEFVCIKCNKQLKIYDISELENLCMDCYEHVSSVNNVDFDIEIMEKALKSERFKLPRGLQPEEIRDHILRKGK